jgi:hypothetical protein
VVRLSCVAVLVSVTEALGMAACVGSRTEPERLALNCAAAVPESRTILIIAKHSEIMRFLFMRRSEKYYRDLTLISRFIYRHNSYNCIGKRLTKG